MSAPSDSQRPPSQSYGAASMEKIVSLCKRRGFIFQSSEIYGGLNGLWDYGPLGVELKRNVKNYWWRVIVHERDDVVGMDGSILTHPEVLKASGHVEGFSDPMVDCRKCKARLRADQVIEKKGVRQCPNCGGRDLTEARPFNLMFQTQMGAAADESSIAYLRPETAQSIFVQFKNILEVSRKKLPFGIAQIGKAFRNEINPRNFTFRSREFEQMELEFFIRPDEVVEAICGKVASAAEVSNIEHRTSNDEHRTSDAQPSTLNAQRTWGWEAWHKYWVEQRIRWYESIGLPRATLVEYWQKAEELAHYARATVDILFKFPFSKRDDRGELAGEELEGIAARGDFDLSQHQRFSGKPMGVFDEELKVAWAKLDEATKKNLGQRYHKARLEYLTKSGAPAEQAAQDAKADADGLAKGQYIPHVIEPSAGVDSLILALICHAYSEDQAPDEKGKLESRVVMRFHPRVAPIKVAIFPLLKNRPELVRKAGEVRELLRPHMSVFYDEVGAIGRRYRRQDEAGTPFGVTIDFDTLGEKGPELKDTVTLRDRDSMKQERVRIGDLLPLLLEKVR